MALGVLVLLAPSVASAYIEGGQNNRATIKSDQTIDDDLYIASSDVTIEGTVNGDVYAAGSSVTIRGTVNGDVIAAGSDVLVGGNVKGSVRLAGSSVRLSGATVGGSATGFANSFVVERDSKIGGGLNFGASSASIRGDVARGIVGGAGTVVIASQVGKNVDVSAEDITLESSAKVDGGLTYYGNGNLHRDSGSQVAGEVKQVHKEAGRDRNQERQNKALEIIWGLIALYLFGALLLWLAPVAMRGVGATIVRRPGLSVATGALVLLLALPIFIVLLISLIGIPMALVFAVLLVIAIYLSKFFAALAVGNLIARRTDWRPNPYADAIVGLLLLTLLELIPGIGWLVKFAVVLFGLGAIVIWFYNRRGGRSLELSYKSVKA